MVVIYTWHAVEKIKDIKNSLICKNIYTKINRINSSMHRTAAYASESINCASSARPETQVIHHILQLLYSVASPVILFIREHDFVIFDTLDGNGAYLQILYALFQCKLEKHTSAEWYLATQNRDMTMREKSYHATSLYKRCQMSLSRSWRADPPRWPRSPSNSWNLSSLGDARDREQSSTHTGDEIEIYTSSESWIKAISPVMFRFTVNHGFMGIIAFIKQLFHIRSTGFTTKTKQIKCNVNNINSIIPPNNVAP